MKEFSARILKRLYEFPASCWFGNGPPALELWWTADQASTRTTDARSCYCPPMTWFSTPHIHLLTGSADSHRGPPRASACPAWLHLPVGFSDKIRDPENYRNGCEYGGAARTLDSTAPGQHVEKRRLTFIAFLYRLIAASYRSRFRIAT